MKSRIEGNTFIRVGTAVVAPASLDLKFANNVLEDVGVGVHLTDPPQSLLSGLGLRPDTPPAEVASLIQELRGARDKQALTERVESRGVSKWLSDGASVAALVDFLWKVGSALTK